MRFALVGSFLVLFAASVEAGQAGGTPESTGLPFTSTLTPRTAVRIRSTILPDPVRGQVVEVDDAVVTVFSEGGTLFRIPVSSIIAMDVNMGHRRNWIQGMAVGATIGYLVGRKASVSPSGCQSLGPQESAAEYCSRNEALAYETVGMGLVGAGIGWLIKSDRWTALNLDVRPSITAGGRAATVNLAFGF